MSYKLSPVPHANIWDTTTQEYTGSTTGQHIYLNTLDDEESGITIEDGYQIHFTNPGLYEIIYSIILTHTTGTNVAQEIWFQDDGVDVPYSNTRVLAKDSGDEQVITASIIGRATGSNYASMRWYCATSAGELLATAAGDRPAVPSVLITIKKVSN